MGKPAGAGHHALQGFCVRLGVRFTQGAFGLNLQGGERRAQLVRGIGDEPPLTRLHAGKGLEQVVECPGDRLHFGGADMIQRAEILRTASPDLLCDRLERLEAAADTEPDQEQGRARKQRLGGDHRNQDFTGERGSLDEGFAHDYRDAFGGSRQPDRDGANRHPFELGVVKTSLQVRRWKHRGKRECSIAEQGSLVFGADGEKSAIRNIPFEDVDGFGRKCETHLPVGDLHLFAERTR